MNRFTRPGQEQVDPDSGTLEPGPSGDLRRLGHWGTGYLELTARSYDDTHRAKRLIRRAYEGE